MFSRSNLSKKFKEYVKFTRAVKSNLVSGKQSFMLRNKELFRTVDSSSKCKEYYNRISLTKNEIMNSNQAAKFRKTLSAAQVNFNKNKEHKVKLAQDYLKSIKTKKIWNNVMVLSVAGSRSSNNTPSKTAKVTPEAPLIPDAACEATNHLNALGLADLSSIGSVQAAKFRKILSAAQINFNKNKENKLKLAQDYLNRIKPRKTLNSAILLNAVGLRIFDDTSSKTTDVIPEPPPIPDAASEIANHLNALGEPSFASLGLGGWSPIGIVQNAFEYVHITLGIPWWETILIGTIVIRILMFPLVIIAQKNAAKMNNYLPQMQVIQLKMTEARQSGNQLEAARYSQELMLFMKEKNLNPLKNMIVPLAQMPVFVSFFVGLRQMANVPVESLRTGGLFWFTDLTVPDQFFALPVITSLTLWATIELGTDSAKLSSQNLQTMKYVLRALPVIILPFTVNFPGAILCYWVSSNFISLMQVGFLRIPAVRDYFKIEPHLKHDPTAMPIKSKGFVGGIKDSWTNMKLTKELEERRRLDEMQFQRAGKGPIVKTYKHDPTKTTATANNPHAIIAKKR